VFLFFVLLLPLFLVGFISSLPNLLWDKKAKLLFVFI
jgi:hypothetical protein